MKYEISLYQNQGFGVDVHSNSKRDAMKMAVELRGSANFGDSSSKIVVYAIGDGPEPNPVAEWRQTCSGRWYRATI